MILNKFILESVKIEMLIMNFVRQKKLSCKCYSVKDVGMM